jgi:hypothetical protein
MALRLHRTEAGQWAEIYELRSGEFRGASIHRNPGAGDEGLRLRLGVCEKWDRTSLGRRVSRPARWGPDMVCSTGCDDDAREQLLQVFKPDNAETQDYDTE